MRTTRISSDFIIEAKAVEVLKDYDLFFCVPIDIFRLAELLEISLQPYPNQDSGIMGMILRTNNDFTIIYSTKINNLGLHRFTIAHEMGHYFLPEHCDHALKNGQHISNQKYKPWYEIEADYFATCLLMPKKLFQAEMAKFSDGLEGILALSKIFHTSITATALRYAELAEFPISVIFSTNGVIGFTKHSKSMFRLARNLPRNGSQIPPHSKSFAIYTANMPAKLPISLDIWCDCDARIMASEIYISLGEYQKRLTVLTTDYDFNAIEEFDEINEEWKPPKFK